MYALLSISMAISRAVSAIGRVAAWLALPMMAIILFDVIQRKVVEYYPAYSETVIFRTFTSTKLQEMEWHLHAVLFLFCLGFAYMKDAHVRIELVRDHLPARLRVWIELLGCLLFLIPYCYIVVRYGFDFAERAFKSGEVSSALTGLTHRWIIKLALPIAFTVLAVSALSVALRCIVYLFGPIELRHSAGLYAGTHHADVPREILDENGNNGESGEAR